MLKRSARRAAFREATATTTMILHVLLIEEDDILRQVIRLVLVEAGCSVASVAKAKDALDVIAHGHRFDAILCDVELEGMAARQLHDAVAERSEDQASRMIFVRGLQDPATGKTNEAATTEEDALPAFLRSRCLNTPFSRETLLGKIRTVTRDAASTPTRKFRAIHV